MSVAKKRGLKFLAHKPTDKGQLRKMPLGHCVCLV